MNIQKPIQKILIANRGEIAVRIARACAEMDIKCVAIYTDADRYGLHISKADEAYNIGPESVAGYLSIPRIVNLAVATGCDAIHPGYGFLSENPALAEQCAARGIRFIGPNADIIRRMGNKIEARLAMQQAQIPVVPGSDHSLANLEEAQQIANEIGYPVMLKATAGGGGRGIRLCHNEAELIRNYDRVISEVTKAFGNSDVFIEKAIINPRHIEVQVLADSHGNTVHLYERDCSIQRRHQKLLEIAPSPQINSEQREYLGALAVRAAQAVNYENAGTVEFLLTQDQQFYFMEMNTRLQVEHPVTETITGIDLVQQQIRVAAGEVLRFKQEDIRIRGYAMEMRINAEDPQNDFLPSFGRITRYFAAGGPGVRTDGGIYTGYHIPPHYDSMLLKLIVWALDWDAVIARAKRSLKDIKVQGVKTTLPYYQQILQHPDFIAGSFDTSFVEQHPELTQYSVKASRNELAAVVSAAIAAHLQL
ncbi:MAG: acetyl-CoA carboxylase biotin carboxylase subunit [Gammaproteobacteria bacterium]|nr:acetyl-CoA carboxylase biotin carboxylase subunit [Gammaproteobacteria bacterium]